MEFGETRIPDISIDKFENEIFLVSIFWFLMNFTLLSLNYIFPVKYTPSKFVTDKFVLFIFFSYELIAISLFIASGLNDGDGHWARSKEEFMHEQGTAALLLVFSAAGLRLFSVALLVHKIFNSDSYLKYVLCLIFLAFTDIYTTGNRVTLLVILFASIFNLFVLKKFKILTVAFLLSIPFGFFMTMYRILRSQLHSEDSFLDGFQKGWYLAIDNMHLDSKIVLEFVSGITESINFNVLLGVFRDFGSNVDYIYGASYFKSIVWWIPRSVYENKPETITVIAANHFAPFSDGSLVTTAIGEGFINFSYLGVVLTPILLFVFKRFLIGFFGCYRFASILLMIYGFIIFRMAFSDLFIYLCFSFLFFWSYNYFSKKRFLF